MVDKKGHRGENLVLKSLVKYSATLLVLSSIGVGSAYLVGANDAQEPENVEHTEMSSTADEAPVDETDNSDDTDTEVDTDEIDSAVDSESSDETEAEAQQKSQEDESSETSAINKDLTVPVREAARQEKSLISDQGVLYYQIVWGDTLSELALTFDTTVDELARQNNIKNVDLIYAGEYLIIGRE